MTQTESPNPHKKFLRLLINQKDLNISNLKTYFEFKLESLREENEKLQLQVELLKSRPISSKDLEDFIQKLPTIHYTDSEIDYQCKYSGLTTPEFRLLCQKNDKNPLDLLKIFIFSAFNKKDFNAKLTDSSLNNSQINFLKKDKDHLFSQNEELRIKLGFLTSKYTEKETALLIENEKLTREARYYQEKFNEIHKDLFKKSLEINENLVSVKELDRIKEILNSAHSKELNFFRERLAELTLKSKSDDVMLKEQNEELISLRNEVRALLQDKKRKVINQQESSLKSSESFSHLKLEMDNKYATTRISELNTKVIALTEELQKSQAEYYSLKSYTEERLYSVNNELSLANLKLKEYEKLEQEFDGLIEKTSESDVEDQEKVFKLINHYPLSLRRRTEHCLRLSRQIVNLEKERRVLINENSSLKEEIVKVRDQLATTESVINQIDGKKPDDVMNSLLVKSKQIFQLMSEKSLLMNENMSLKKRLIMSENDKRELIKDINVLLKKV